MHERGVLTLPAFGDFRGDLFSRECELAVNRKGLLLETPDLCVRWYFGIWPNAYKSGSQESVSKLVPQEAFLRRKP